MGQKKSKTLKSLRKKVKKIQKNNILKSIINSSVFLVLLLVLSTIQLIQLWKNKDNESLFLFVLIAFIVYNQFKTKNMIYVLGIPFVVVNLLTYLRSLFRVEPFIGEDNDDNKIKEICNTIDIKNDTEDDCIEKIKSLETDDITANLMSDYTEVGTENDDLKNFIRKEVSDISSSILYQEQEMELNKKTIQSLSTDASFVQMVENIPYYKEKHEQAKLDLPMNIISSNSNNNDVKQVIKNMLNRLYTKIIDTGPEKSSIEKTIFTNIYKNIDEDEDEDESPDDNVDDTQSMNT
mgnify:CR=1 FL=1